MTLQVHNRVKETTTTTGTGALTLAGAMTGFLRFSARLSVGDTCYCTTQAVDANGAPTGDWECGLYTYSGTNTLTRTTVKQSSNSDAAVSFAAGTKQVWIDLEASQYVNQVAPLGSDAISGLKMVWVSTTALTVNPGEAAIQSSGIVAAASAIAKTGLSLTASTWYHVYLYNNAGTPDVEIVTTAPAAAYNGTARSKTGDTSRRYIGSVRADTTGALTNFYHNPVTGRIAYLVDLNSTNLVLHLVNAGASTTTTSVDCSSVAPVTARFVVAFAENNGATGVVFIGNADLGTPANTNTLAFLRALRTIDSELYLNSSQAFTYMVTSPGTFDFYATGYVYER
jgi:hypothetical protein